MYQEQTNNQKYYKKNYRYNQNQYQNNEQITNKDNIINPYTLIVNKVEPYTQFLEYGRNVDILEFALNFYNTNKLDNNILHKKILFLFFQRFFVGGLTSGSVKN